MSTDLDYYRKPKGWVEFWIGLALLIFCVIFFGRIIHQENKVKISDEKYYQQLETKRKHH